MRVYNYTKLCYAGPSQIGTQVTGIKGSDRFSLQDYQAFACVGKWASRNSVEGGVLMGR